MILLDVVAVAAFPPILKSDAVPVIFVPTKVGVVVKLGVDPPTKTPVPVAKDVAPDPV